MRADQAGHSSSCSLLPSSARHAPFKQSAQGRPRQRSCVHACRHERRPVQRFAQSIAESTAAGLMALAALLSPCQPAGAVLNSPNASIARTTDAALRRAIPATNPEVKAVQRNLEDIAFKLRIPQRKPWQQMATDVVKSTKVVYDEAKVMTGVPSDQEENARALLQDIREGLVKINAAIDAKDADKVSFRTAYTLQNVAALELIQAPGLAFSIPSQYLSLPRLTGRATVEVTFERRTAGGGFVDRGGGGSKPRAQLTLELDGYSAPLTAGNFVASVVGGAFDGAQLSIGGETVSVTGSKNTGKVLPMEILPLGEFEPVYKAALDVQNGELPVLPLSIYGAVAMAHPAADNSDGFAAANEFFLYKFDRSSSGLAGLSFEEGAFPVFGYVTGGLEILPQLESGDQILSAKLVAGAERLVLPEGDMNSAGESVAPEGVEA